MMSDRKISRALYKAIAAVMVAGALNVATPTIVFADGPQCAPRVVAQNIKDAVLALKATEYCLGFDMPWTIEEVEARIDSLRCGSQSSEILDGLINDYDREYRTILVSDHRHIVCKQAQTIQFK